MSGVAIRDPGLGAGYRHEPQTRRSKITKDMISFRGLMKKRRDADLLREMIGLTAQRLIALEASQLTGPAHGEKSVERLVQRNGYRERDREARAATVELRNPKLRMGSYLPLFLQPRRLAETALCLDRRHPT